MLVDEKVCPLCGKPNNCMAHCSEPCWCNEVKVPEGLSALVPEKLKRKACICRKCIEAYNANPGDFKAGS